MKNTRINTVRLGTFKVTHGAKVSVVTDEHGKTQTKVRRSDGTSVEITGKETRCLFRVLQKHYAS